MSVGVWEEEGGWRSHYETLKKKIRLSKPDQFEHENIEKFYEHIVTSLDDLISSNEYDHSLSEVILSNISSGCFVGGVFKVEICLMLIKVKAAVRVVKFMTPENADIHMTQESLDIKTILKTLVTFGYCLSYQKGG